MRRLRRLIGISLLPLLLWLALPLVSQGSPASRLNQLQSEISSTRGRLHAKQGRVQVLSTDITAWNNKIAAIQGDITRLEAKKSRIQADLDSKRADLLRTRTQLDAEQARLARLRARLAQAQRVLRQRLVALYESARPDLVTVVLNSHGFADLLDQASFLRRIGQQDRRIIDAVRVAKAQTVATTKKLGALEAHQQAVAAQILARRNQVGRVKVRLVKRRRGYRHERAVRRHALSHVRAQAASIKGHLDSLQAASDKVQRELAAQQAPASTAAPVAGPQQPSSAGLIWPVNGPITSPFCEPRPWEACHPGIDIGVPEGTPIHAAAAGTVVLMQTTATSGGYGNFTCIQHTASMSTCYAHQSRFATSMGAHVAQGQVIGYTGCTGRCFGPHLHFEVRIGGAVQNPLNYLP